MEKKDFDPNCPGHTYLGRHIFNGIVAAKSGGVKMFAGIWYTTSPFLHR